MTKALILALILVVIIFIIFLKQDQSDQKLIAEGNDLVEKIEAYRTEHGRLPNSLEKLGIKQTEEGPLFYNKWDSAHYLVWYGIALGESVTYFSDSKKWEEVDRGFDQTK